MATPSGSLRVRYLRPAGIFLRHARTEVIYTFGLKQGVVTVTAKPGHGCSPKDYEEREIPIPDELVTLLTEWKRKPERVAVRFSREEPFVFRAKNGAAQFDFLDICKRFAKRAKLNPDDFWSHKFRATFATCA